jgi:hypothetical protein
VIGQRLDGAGGRRGPGRRQAAHRVTACDVLDRDHVRAQGLVHGRRDEDVLGDLEDPDSAEDRSHQYRLFGSTIDFDVEIRSLVYRRSRVKPAPILWRPAARSPGPL